MGHKKTRDLESQVDSRLKKMLCIGRSKQQDKIAGISSGDKIYSYTTYHVYKQNAVLFTEYCKQHGCRTLDECKQYAAEYVGRYTSPSTMSTKTAALCKLFQCNRSELGIELPERSRAGITRTRTAPKHWSVERHPDVAAFLAATGLRRHEAEMLHGSDFEEHDGRYYIHVRTGKGGKERFAQVYGDVATVLRLMLEAGRGLVFPEGIQDSCPVHYFRAQYATALYDSLARDLETCKNDPFWNPQHCCTETRAGRTVHTHKPGYDQNSVYWCRDDRVGTWFDKQAMLIVSRNLGHNRISVCGEHYIHNIKEDAINEEDDL